MAPYDSDDSLDDDQDYTETDVLLGYASKEPNGETLSKLGGRPDWIIPTQPPSSTHAKCPHCAHPQVLLLQLNGDLPDRFPGHERRLYVFACRSKACRRKERSVRALRAVRVSADAAKQARERREKEERDKAERERREEERRAKEKGLGEALFGVAGAGGAMGGGKGAFGGNPFSTGGAAAGKNPFATSGGNPFATKAAATESDEKKEKEAEEEDAAATASKDLPRTFAETLSLNNTQATSGPPPPPLEPWPAESELPPAYATSYLSEADYETLDPQPAMMPQQNVSTSAMEIESSTGGGGGKEDKDVFESTIDSTFQKFADRLAQNPDQCIRYEFGGAPLLYSKTDAVGKKLHDVAAGEVGRVLPRCGECGAQRAFEVQLTPQAIVELEGDEELEGMDWGTVIVAVCERDCVPRFVVDGEVGYVEEWAGVQWEELTARR